MVADLSSLTAFPMAVIIGMLALVFAYTILFWIGMYKLGRKNKPLLFAISIFFSPIAVISVFIPMRRKV